MKKSKLSILLLLFLVLGVAKEGLSQGTGYFAAGHFQNIGIPSFSTMNDRIYMCAQYTVSYSYRKNKYSKRSKYEERDVCSCFIDLDYVVENNKRSYSGTIPAGFARNTIIIWDRNFIANHLLPMFRDIEDRRKINYTLNHSNDSTFKNIIDYNNKVVINDKMYYYPLKIRTCLTFSVDYNWLKEVVPESSWIYKPDCFDAGKGMRVDVLIPLLQMPWR